MLRLRAAFARLFGRAGIVLAPRGSDLALVAEIPPFPVDEPRSGCAAGWHAEAVALAEGYEFALAAARLGERIWVRLQAPGQGRGTALIYRKARLVADGTAVSDVERLFICVGCASAASAPAL